MSVDPFTGLYDEKMLRQLRKILVDRLVKHHPKRVDFVPKLLLSATGWVAQPEVLWDIGVGRTFVPQDDILVIDIGVGMLDHDMCERYCLVDNTFDSWGEVNDAGVWRPATPSDTWEDLKKCHPKANPSANDLWRRRMPSFSGSKQNLKKLGAPTLTEVMEYTNEHDLVEMKRAQDRKRKVMEESITKIYRGLGWTAAANKAAAFLHQKWDELDLDHPESEHNVRLAILWAKKNG